MDYFLRYQKEVRELYEKPAVEAIFALIILVRFVLTSIESQIFPESGSEMYETFKSLNLIFDVVFTIELLFNLYGGFYEYFFSENWNIFDLVIVTLSWLDHIFSEASNFIYFIFSEIKDSG